MELTTDRRNQRVTEIASRLLQMYRYPVVGYNSVPDPVFFNLGRIGWGSDEECPLVLLLLFLFRDLLVGDLTRYRLGIRRLGIRVARQF